jgi:hypothetical protein
VSAFPYAAGADVELSERLEFLDIATPAAGALASFTPSRETAVRVLAARATLTTDANVADRFLALDYMKAGGATYVRNGDGPAITASTTAQTFEWTANRGQGAWVTGGPVFLPVLPIWLPPGFAIRFTVGAIQATDQLSGLNLVLERAAP